jgi:hypothetical protein
MWLSASLRISAGCELLSQEKCVFTFPRYAECEITIDTRPAILERRRIHGSVVPMYEPLMMLRPLGKKRGEHRKTPGFRVEIGV